MIYGGDACLLRLVTIGLRVQGHGMDHAVEQDLKTIAKVETREVDLLLANQTFSVDTGQPVTDRDRGVFQPQW